MTVLLIFIRCKTYGNPIRIIKLSQVGLRLRMFKHRKNVGPVGMWAMMCKDELFLTGHCGAQGVTMHDRSRDQVDQLATRVTTRLTHSR